MNEEARDSNESENVDIAPAPPVRGERTEVWVGLFVLVGLFAILFGLFTFTSPSLFRGRYVISTSVPEAGGIRRGDAVQYRGVTIGRIQGFEIAPSGVTVRLEIERRYRVPRDSHVELSSNALVGGATAQIMGGESTEPVAPGAVLPGAAAKPLPEKFGELATESEKTLERLQNLLSQRTVSGVEGSVEQLQALLTELAQTVAAQRSDLEQMTRSLSATARSAQKIASSPEFERSVRRLDSITTQLDQASASIDRASRSMDVVLGRIERGEGTLGRLSKDDTLYRNANQALVNLNQTTAAVRALTMDLHANPKRYVHLSVF